MKYDALIKTKSQAEFFCKKVMEDVETGKTLYFSAKSLNGDNIRTHAQNAALHMYFSEMAEELNGAGFEQVKFFRDVVRDGVQIPWSAEAVKECIWRPIQAAKLGKHSSASLTTGEVADIYNIVNREIASRTGVSVQWPSENRFIYGR